MNISRIFDQDNNDIDKCIDCIAHHDLISTETNVSFSLILSLCFDILYFFSKDWTILIICPFGGRYDHELAILHSSFRWLETFHRVILISNETISHAIPIGRNELIFQGDGTNHFLFLATTSSNSICHRIWSLLWFSCSWWRSDCIN